MVLYYLRTADGSYVFTSDGFQIVLVSDAIGCAACSPDFPTSSSVA